MTIIPDSMATPNGFTFTVGQITWTTGSNDFIAMNTEEVQIQSAPTTVPPASVTAPIALGLTPSTPALSSATSTTRRSLPCYKGKQIDDTDLLDSIDRVGTKFAETLALVDSIQNQSTKQVTVDHNRSTRPARASRRARLGTDLVVTTTPEGRSVRHQSVPATGLRLSEYEALMENYQVQPYGLRNIASDYTYNLQRCWDHRSRPHNFVNMVRVEEYQEGSVHMIRESSSSSSSTASDGSDHTELQYPGNEEGENDLETPDHPPGFPRFPSFPPNRGDLINIVSNDEPPAVGETEQEKLAREARNFDRLNHRQAGAEAEEEARRIRLQPRDLNNAFDRVGEKQVFRTPSANVAVAMATLQSTLR